MATPKRKTEPTHALPGKTRRKVATGQLVKVATAARDRNAALSTRSGQIRPPQLPQAQLRTAFLIETFGSASAVAELLEVSRSQPGKWRTGAESPSPAASALLIDLDHVIARATLLWPAAVAKRWLVGTEPLLGGARPIDVLRLRGSREVIDALDAVTSGAYA